MKRKVIKFVFLVIFLLIEFLCFFLLAEAGLRISAFVWKNVYRAAHQKDNNFYIYVMGESTSYGTPFAPKISFPKIISYMFNNQIQGKEIKIIDLSGAGRNVEYGYWRLAAELFVKPRLNGIVLIYSGVNEHRARVYSADPTFKRWQLMQDSLILSRAQYLLEGRVPQDSDIYNFFGLNNSLSKYEYRLRKIISIAKRFDLNIIISTLAGNICRFSPQNDNIFWPNEVEAIKLFNSGAQFEKAKEFKKAIEKYQDILEKFPQDYPTVYYHLGKCYEQLKIYGQARQHYWKVVDIGDIVRPSRWQNNIIRDLAQEYNIGLVDTIQIFEGNSPFGLLGYNLMSDAHHPNLEGYVLLAKSFAEEMEKILGQRISKRHPGSKEIAKYFNFSEEDFLKMYISRAEWLCFESLAIYDKEERLIWAEDYLKKAEDIKKTPDTYFWRLIIAILRKDKDSALYWLEKGELLKRNSGVFSKYRKRWPRESEYLRLFKELLPEDVLNEITKI